jgi:hypothetical protein
MQMQMPCKIGAIRFEPRCPEKLCNAAATAPWQMESRHLNLQASVTVVIGVALRRVIGLRSLGSFLAQHHGIFRLLIVLTVLLGLGTLLLLLSLIGR